ncbi:hypothetical protein [Streptomyces antnestii]|uniref:hypothetical protein n=1 Tax=Streptomyces antnestii TaxID=2494256 RepID=UPI00167BD2F8|nr:hypothetical protein [Streptomyces sp. San01]
MSNYSGACRGLPCRERDGLPVGIVSLLSQQAGAMSGAVTELLCAYEELGATD